MLRKIVTPPFIFLAVMALVVSCRSQNPVTPTQYTCPPAGSYTSLNSTGTTSTTYSDTPPSGSWCYIGQGTLPASGGVAAQTGGYSNTVGPVAAGATGKVNLSMSCTANPTGNPPTTCTGVLWGFFRAAAIAATAPAIPAMGAPTESQLVKPGPVQVLAKNGTTTGLLVLSFGR